MHGVQVRQRYTDLLQALHQKKMCPKIELINAEYGIAVNHHKSGSQNGIISSCCCTDAMEQLNQAVQTQLQFLTHSVCASVAEEWLLKSTPGQFSLLGLDFLLDDCGRFMLLEVTKGKLIL